MGSRQMPLFCPHGQVIDWGDFGPDDWEPLPECEECDDREQFAFALRRLFRVVYREILVRPLRPVINRLDRWLGG